MASSKEYKEFILEQLKECKLIIERSLSLLVSGLLLVLVKKRKLKIRRLMIRKKLLRQMRRRMMKI